MSGCYKFHDGEREVTAVGYEGRTRLHLAVITDTGVAALDVPRDEARYLRPLTLKGAPYPLDRCVKAMRAVGRRAGITQGAADILKTVLTEGLL